MCDPIGDILAGSSHSRVGSPSLDDMLIESSATRMESFVTPVQAGTVRITPTSTATRLQIVDRRPDPVSSRLITEHGDDDDGGEKSSNSTGETVRPIIRGKDIEHMAKHALMAASLEAIEPVSGLGQTISKGGNSDNVISREDINDVANDRQLRPYHDLSAASDEFIRRRRDCILEARSEQLGMTFSPKNHPVESWTSDSATEDYMDDETRGSIKASLIRASMLNVGEMDQGFDIEDNNEEEQVDEEDHHRPVRLSKRQVALAAKGKLTKLPASFVDETSEEEYKEGSPTLPTKRGRRPLRLKRSCISTAKKGPKRCEFPIKLHKMLDEADPDIVAWLPHGRAFRVNNTQAFVEDVLPAYGFRQSKITSFYRQLNLYGFSRVIKGGYYHECFLRGKPNLIKGMVRVKVKGAGHRPKPSEIAKTQPNLYDMAPIDAKAKAFAAGRIGKEEEVGKVMAKEKKRALSTKKKEKSKSRRGNNSSLSPESIPREIAISPIPLVEPDSFEPIGFGAGMVEDCGDNVRIKSCSGPSQALLAYRRLYPARSPSGTKPNEITPSPVPKEAFNPSSSRVSFHEHVYPPPLYRNPVPQAPAFRDFSSSTFHMHQYVLKKQQISSSAWSVTEHPMTAAQVNNEQCPEQYPGESSSQKASDAELLIEDWHNTKKPSSIAFPGLLGREVDAAGDMWLPTSPTNVPVEEDRSIDHLGAAEKGIADTEFGQVLDSFLDSL